VSPKLLAERDGKPIALAWLGEALARLDALLRGEPDDVTRAALSVSFAFDRVAPDAQRGYAQQVRDNVAAIASIVENSARWFFDADEAEARRFFPTAPPPAYAVYERGVFFTAAFARVGPKCRAAMVVHEAFHVVDPRSGDAEVHVSEWDEPRFSSLSPEQAIHNPSAYASFCAQVHARRVDWPREARFGAGNPDE
jgi:hypothetical protein